MKLTHNQDRLIDAMKWVLAILGSLLAAATAAGQQEVTSTAVVPVVGSVLGATHAVWKTDVEIVNETGAPTTVALELTALPGTAMILDLGPGASQRFTDIVGQAFGLERVLSPMRITTLGRRSVTVRANAYAIKETTISKMQALGTAYGSEYAPFRALDGLGFSEELRTNIGLVNFSENEVEFLLALQRLPGRDLAITRVTVGPESLLHASIQSLFPLITKGEHFRVVVETLARNTYVYASVIDNEQTGTFIQPRVTSR